MKKAKHLVRREREVMDIIFARHEATLSQIMEDMELPPTRPALRFILTILEGKDQLEHRQQGRENPIVCPFIELLAHVACDGWGRRDFRVTTPQGFPRFRMDKLAGRGYSAGHSFFPFTQPFS